MGNKCDDHVNRQVSYNEGRVLANKLKCQFIETSAKNGTNVDQAFKNIVTQYIRDTRLDDTTQGSSPKELKCQDWIITIIMITCGIGMFVIGLLLFIGIFKAQFGVTIGIGILCILFCCGFIAFGIYYKVRHKLT